MTPTERRALADRVAFLRKEIEIGFDDCADLLEICDTVAAALREPVIQMTPEQIIIIEASH